MGIQLQREIKIQANQTVVIESIIIKKAGKDQKWIAAIRFSILDDSNKIIGEKFISYPGEEFLPFWENFNSLKFLYDELVRKEALNIVVSDAVENDFTI